MKKVSLFVLLFISSFCVGVMAIYVLAKVMKEANVDTSYAKVDAEEESAKEIGIDSLIAQSEDDNFAKKEAGSLDSDAEEDSLEEKSDLSDGEKGLLEEMSEQRDSEDGLLAEPDDMDVKDDGLDEESEETIVEDTGIVVCIDPGHYKAASHLNGENIYGYEESIFTLKVALALKDELEKYGIKSYLTRESDNITISGYSNGDLDHGKISLRGEAAKDADLFVSIHTNANQDNANGYPTCSQPMEINKTIVLANKIAVESNETLKIANEIGKALTKESFDRGLSFTENFREASTDTLKEWNDAYNDALKTEGTVCYRWGQKGDYYGVLRGATNVGVPGFIVEHGFHTIEDMRNQAMNGDLASAWAKADAYGIAKGFGVIQ